MFSTIVGMVWAVFRCHLNFHSIKNFYHFAFILLNTHSIPEDLSPAFPRRYSRSLFFHLTGFFFCILFLFSFLFSFPPFDGFSQYSQYSSKIASIFGFLLPIPRPWGMFTWTIELNGWLYTALNIPMAPSCYHTHSSISENHNFAEISVKTSSLSCSL